MIKASELMVGDKVLHDGKYKEVITIWPRSVSLYDSSQTWGSIYADNHTESEIEPIPLTPEILEKNGFKMAKWKEDEPAGLLGKWWDNRGQVLVKRFDFTLLGEVYSVKANNSRISNIRYVHELQHALRLCGIDKEIVL